MNEGREAPQPGRRAPAPGGLRLVQEFLNSVDIEAGQDRFATPEGLRAWLAARGLLRGGGPVGPAELERAVAVREAVRALALANNGEPLDPEAVARLNQLGAAASLRARFEPDGTAVLEPEAAGVDGALARVLAAIYRAMAEGDWPRLKACRQGTCRWAFFDRSRNRSGAWCAMAVCGNRSKTRSYYRRRRAGPA